MVGPWLGIPKHPSLLSHHSDLSRLVNAGTSTYLLIETSLPTSRYTATSLHTYSSWWCLGYGHMCTCQRHTYQVDTSCFCQHQLTPMVCHFLVAVGVTMSSPHECRASDHQNSSKELDLHPHRRAMFIKDSMWMSSICDHDIPTYSLYPTWHHAHHRFTNNHICILRLDWPTVYRWIGRSLSCLIG